MAPNPYEPPQVSDPVEPAKKVPAGRLGLAIALGLLAFPASIIACFTTCIVGYEVTTGPNTDAPIVVGASVGLAVAIGMIVLAVRTARK